MSSCCDIDIDDNPTKRINRCPFIERKLFHKHSKIFEVFWKNLLHLKFFKLDIDLNKKNYTDKRSLPYKDVFKNFDEMMIVVKVHLELFGRMWDKLTEVWFFLSFS